MIGLCSSLKVSENAAQGLKQMPRRYSLKVSENATQGLKQIFRRCVSRKLESAIMDGIVYLVGLVVIILAILSFLGLR